MSDTARLCELMQAQAQLLSIRIAAEGTKEYKADWLKNTDTVVRDGSGRFAKKGNSSTTTETPVPEQTPTVKERVGQAISDTKKVTSLLLEGGEVTVEMLKKLLTDKNFRRRAGLEAGQTGAQAIKRLAEAAKVNPELTKKLDSYINKFNEDLIKEYGDDGGAMAQAIRKHGNLPPGDNLQQRLELQVAKYKAYEDALDSPEVHKSLVSNIAAASIPVAIGLSIAIAPEIIFASSAFSLTESLIAFAAGETGSWLADTVMEKLNINNPVAKLGVSLGVGILSGGYAAQKINKIRIDKAKKIGDEQIGNIYNKYMGGRINYVDKEHLLVDDDIDSFRKSITTNTIDDFDAVVKNLKDTLDKVKESHKRVFSIKIDEEVIPKLEGAINKLEAKKELLINILGNYEGSNLRKLQKAVKNNHVPRGPKVDNDILSDERLEMLSIIKEIDKEIASFNNGWEFLYKELQDVYTESSLVLNRLKLDPKTGLKYKTGIDML